MNINEALSSLNPLDTLSNLFKTGYGIYQDQRDYRYQKELQNRLFERDDNAIQRRMLDYQKAGINPLMALGSSGASVTSSGFYPGNNVPVDTTFFSTQQQKKLERDTIKQEMDQRKLSMEQMKINLRAGKIANWSAMQDLNTKRLEQDILKKQIEQMKQSGIYPLSVFGKSFVDVNNLILPVLENLLQGFIKTPGVKDVIDNINDPNKIDDFIEGVKDSAQNFANMLGKKVGKKLYISEYEARVLRGSSDKNRSDSKIYGFTNKSGHIGSYGPMHKSGHLGSYRHNYGKI